MIFTIVPKEIQLGLIPTGTLATIKVGGATIVSALDIGVVQVGVLTATGDGRLAKVDSDGVITTIFITDTATYPMRIGEESAIEITLDKVGYASYTNIFAVYGYDISTDIVMVSDIWKLAGYTWAAVLAYRKPFTSRVYYYKTTATTTNTFYNSTSGVDVLLGTTNGFVDNNDEDVIITAKATASSSGDLTVPLTVPKIKWTPDFTLSVTSGCPTSDCLSTSDPNTAQVDIDYSTLGTVVVDTITVYAYNAQRIRYNLYDISGTLVATKIYDFQINPPAYVYDASAHQWTGWVVPEVGDYVVEACLEAIGKLGDSITDPDTPDEDQWYSIYVNTSGDFTGIGAATSVEGVDFVANGDSPIWGDGELKILLPLAECCKRNVLDGCDFFKTTQDGCNVFTVHNLRADQRELVTVGKMTTLGVFEDVPEMAKTLDVGATYPITFTDDGVYQITVSNTDVLILPGQVNTNPDLKYLTQIVINTCKIRACALSYVNDLLCRCKGDECCEDFCKKFYEFNSFVILAHTLFNMIATEYGGSYFYTSLTPSNVATLYEVQQVVDRLLQYCSGCCDECKKARTGCGCGGEH